MKRREFVSSLIGSAGVVALAAAPDPHVTEVLAMFKCHFDAGFIDTQQAVVDKYIEVYFPQAIALAASQRAAGADPYVWTTGSWLVYEYLERTSGAARKRMEEALGRGDLAWHALPFTWQSEVLDVSAIQGCLGFSKTLDRRFGRTTSGAKMTDVPGHTRGLIAPLANGGVSFLDVGVNGASTAPDVPDLFAWKDSGGQTLTVMYHRLAYGGVVTVPGAGLAVSVNVRDDNAGPHTPQEIRTVFADLRRRFPKATVKAASLTEISKAIQPHTSKLPVVTAEIGDTWIYGVPSDPAKVARFRELLRLRREWIGGGKWKVGDEADLRFLRRFALGAEHTWGADTKTWLDFDHYTPEALARMLQQPKYKVMTHSWVEKRDDIQQGFEVLPAGLRTEASGRLAALKPVRPSGKQQRGTTISGAHFDVALDEKTGAIVSLRNKRTKYDWASPEHPLGLFSYQTLSKGDYDRFLAQYITVHTEWAPKDFGKPNIESFGAESKVWNARLIESTFAETDRAHELVAHLRTGAGGKSGCPADVYVELSLPKNDPRVELNVSWFGKPSSRLPEAIWLSFKPHAPREKNWTLSKLEKPVSPFDVIAGGNRHMHALSSGLQYQDGENRFEIETLDAPVVSLGAQTPIYFSKSQPDLTQGLHFSLFNNGWGTNYVQWFGEDMRFRFLIRA